MRKDLFEKKVYLGAREMPWSFYSEEHNNSYRLSEWVEALSPEPVFTVFHYDVRSRHFSGMRRRGNHLIQPAVTNLVVTGNPIYPDGTGEGGKLVEAIVKVAHFTNRLNRYPDIEDMLSVVAIAYPDPTASDVANARLVELYMKCGAVLLYDDTGAFAHLDPVFTDVDFKKTENPILPWSYVGEVPEALANVVAAWHVLHDSNSSVWALEGIDHKFSDGTSSQWELYMNQLRHLKLNSDEFLGKGDCASFFGTAVRAVEKHANELHFSEYFSPDVAGQYPSSRKVAEQGLLVAEIMRIASHAVLCDDTYSRKREKDTLAEEWHRRCQHVDAAKLVETYLKGVPVEDVIAY